MITAASIHCPVCQHSIDVHRLYGCTEGVCEESTKAALFDALADRLPSGAWRVDPREPAAFINSVRITVAATGERFSAERLADAVRMALEAEGDPE